MKSSKPALLFLAFFIALFSNAVRAEKPDEKVPVLRKGYYLVVGAFQIRENAVRYSNRINGLRENSKVGKNPEKNLYYVYVFSTSTDLQLIKDKRTEYRRRKEFANAWIFRNQMEEFDEVEGISIAPEEKAMFEDPEVKEFSAPVGDAPETTSKERETTEGEGFKYLFNVVNITTLKEVHGKVTVVDGARDQVFTSVETNTPVVIPDPGTATKEVIFVADIFGYVKQQTALSLLDPLGSGEPNVAVAEDGGTTVNFELQRYKPGDIITMYHVYFYNDAAIMKPESQFELNSLLEMLRENDNLSIRIHGHTNGNASGKIVKLAEGDNNFFEVSASNIQGIGSAKELSFERANTIKNWLIHQGIEEKRMDLKGWGGKKMLYDKKSDQAGRNVRVEIEILKD